MNLTADDWEEIRKLEARIGRIFDLSERLPTEFGMFPIPACCFAGRPGYDRITQLRRQIRYIKSGKAILAGKEGEGR